MINVKNKVMVSVNCAAWVQEHSHIFISLVSEMAKMLPHAAAVRCDLLAFNTTVLTEDLQFEINLGTSSES